MYAVLLICVPCVNTILAPSKPTKQSNTKRPYVDSDGRHSPLLPLDYGLVGKASVAPAQNPAPSGSAPKPSSLLRPNVPPAVKVPVAATPLGHIRETLPMPFILQQPEEQTDNWDDDFEDGISLTKLQGHFLSVLSIYGV